MLATFAGPRNPAKRFIWRRGLLHPPSELWNPHGSSDALFVPAARAIALEERLSLRLRATGRTVRAVVVDVGPRMRVRVLDEGVYLGPQDFTDGVDIHVFEGSLRFSREQVAVLGFDGDRAEVHFAGPVVLEPVRRRATFRERLELEVLIAPFDDGGPPFLRGGLGPIAVEAITLDVGGGGISVECRRPLEVDAGSLVRVEVDVEGFSVRAVAKVAWLQQKSSGRTVAGLGFTQVEERGHDRLYRHLYELQRQYRLR
ncbi:MAG: hypothetical protein AAFU79_02760 [Myxococcota bacterium]